MALQSFEYPESQFPGAVHGDALVAMQARAPRTLTLLLVGRIIGARRDALCRIRNLSEGGLRAEVRARFVVGERIRIEFRNSDAVTGMVRWADRKWIGVQFDAPVNVARLLAESSSIRRRGAHQARAPRLLTRCSAELRVDGLVQRASLLDLSQGGAKLHVRAPLETGRMLTLAVPGLEPIRAVVRWARGEEAGIAFLEPIAFGTLAEWLNDSGTRFAAVERAG